MATRGFARCRPPPSGASGAPAAEAVPSLVTTLRDQDKEVRQTAALALEMIGAKPEISVPALIKALQDDDAEMRSYASDALGAFGSRALPQLLLALKDSAHPQVRLGAARALGRTKVGSLGVLRGLATALGHDEDARVRSLVALALDAFGRKAVPFLEDALRDVDGEVRASAAYALGRIRKAGVSMGFPATKPFMR